MFQLLSLSTFVFFLSSSNPALAGSFEKRVPQDNALELVGQVTESEDHTQVKIQDPYLSMTGRHLGPSVDLRFTPDQAAEVCQRMGYSSLVEGTIEWGTVSFPSTFEYAFNFEYYQPEAQGPGILSLVCRIETLTETQNVTEESKDNPTANAKDKPITKKDHTRSYRSRNQRARKHQGRCFPF